MICCMRVYHNKWLSLDLMQHRTGITCFLFQHVWNKWYTKTAMKLNQFNIRFSVFDVLIIVVPAVEGGPELPPNYPWTRTSHIYIETCPPYLSERKFNTNCVYIYITNRQKIQFMYIFWSSKLLFMLVKLPFIHQSFD